MGSKRIAGVTYSSKQIPFADFLSGSNGDRSFLKMDERSVDIFAALQNDVVARNLLYIVLCRIEIMRIFVCVDKVREKMRARPFFAAVLCPENDTAARRIHVLAPAVILL